MIETIFSNDNEEADKTGTAQTAFKMPKNIRQIGKSNVTKKIYLEDYVMTYIKQLAGGDYSGCKIAVLVGQCIKMENCRNIFISGAVEVNNIDTLNEIVFTNDIWTEIYEDIKKYFVETEIVGWYIGGPGYLLTIDDKILKTHIDNFAGQDKVLLVFDNMEKEETFLSYENNRLSKQDGYYIYYEKNEEMQNYIIDHKQTGSSEENYDDKVSREIRTIIQNKKSPEEENKSITKLMYAAGTLLAVIVLIVGAAMLRNYDQMKSMQETLNYLSQNMEKVQASFTEKGNLTATADGQALDTQANPDATTESDGESLDVEVVPGNVEPLSEDNSQSNKDGNNSDDSGTASDKELAGESTGSQEVKDNEKATDSQKAADSEAAANSEKISNSGKTTNSENAAKADSEKTADTDTGSKSTKSASSNTAGKAIKHYVVEDGDTLADISYKLYNTYTKVKKIMQLNGIEDQDLIYVGQKLIVP